MNAIATTGNYAYNSHTVKTKLNSDFTDTLLKSLRRQARFLALYFFILTVTGPTQHAFLSNVRFRSMIPGYRSLAEDGTTEVEFKGLFI